jgi:hypothetical protein
MLRVSAESRMLGFICEHEIEAREEVRKESVADMLDDTGCTQIHSQQQPCPRWRGVALPCIFQPLQKLEKAILFGCQISIEVDEIIGAEVALRGQPSPHSLSSGWRCDDGSTPSWMEKTEKKPCGRQPRGLEAGGQPLRAKGIAIPCSEWILSDTGNENSMGSEHREYAAGIRSAASCTHALARARTVEESKKGFHRIPGTMGYRSWFDPESDNKFRLTRDIDIDRSLADADDPGFCAPGYDWILSHH